MSSGPRIFLLPSNPPFSRPLQALYPIFIPATQKEERLRYEERMVYYLGGGVDLMRRHLKTMFRAFAIQFALCYFVAFFDRTS
jgi:hypothetical protein